MDPRPRLLRIGPDPGHLDGAVSAADVEAVPADPGEVARRLRDGNFTAVFAAPEVVAGLLDRFRRDELILGHIDKGLAVLDPAGTITWTNAAFRACSGGDPLGKPLLDALGSPRVVSVETVRGDPEADGPADRPLADPLAPARRGQAVTLRLHRPSPNPPYLEADIRPVIGPDRTVSRLIVTVRDVTAEVIQQQKFDALHAAGRELAGLDPDQLADMNIPSRIELLKLNLRRCIHDLLHYDTIEVRVLDRKTGELKPLLEDGMGREAAGRVLFAQSTGNGVTGYVASTGHSYLCADTARDPLYIKGAEGARSSMTVPLKVQDEVIGTLNVESPRPNGFGPDDLQFTELFSKEIAAALHTLDLLSAQVGCTASQSIEAVNREIALPLDEVLASASMLLARAGADTETANHLRRILESARLVKKSVSKGGRDLATEQAGANPGGIEAPTPLVGKRLLVVDADERVRRQAHLLLTRLGATAETAETATAGLAMATDNAYDAIFLDVRPPDLGGYESYRRFRAARPEAVLALTTGFGYDVAHSIPKARQDGLKYVLFKPFREEQVTRAVLDPVTTPGPAATLISGA